MLVFVQSIDRARELFHELVYEGINVEVIHADRTQQQVHTYCTVLWVLTAVQPCIKPPPLCIGFRGTTWWTVSAPVRFGCWSAQLCSPEESTSKESTWCWTTTSPPALWSTSTESVSYVRLIISQSDYLVLGWNHYLMPFFLIFLTHLTSS